MTFWSLFRRRPPSVKMRQEPVLGSDLLACGLDDFERPAPPCSGVLALPAPSYQHPYPFDFRHISPRHFAEIAHELYLEGQFQWAEYQLIGHPTELRRDYNTTIGALTGEKARPDSPRDMLAEWEKRLDFMRRFHDDKVPVVERAVEILRRYSSPPSQSFHCR